MAKFYSDEKFYFVEFESNFVKNNKQMDNFSMRAKCLLH